MSWADEIPRDLDDLRSFGIRDRHRVVGVDESVAVRRWIVNSVWDATSEFAVRGGVYLRRVWREWTGRSHSGNVDFEVKWPQPRYETRFSPTRYHLRKVRVEAIMPDTFDLKILYWPNSSRTAENWWEEIGDRRAYGTGVEIVRRWITPRL